MQHKNRLFFKNNQEVFLKYTAEEISSDGGLVISERIEKESGLIKKFCKKIIDNRHKSYTIHNTYKIVKQRVFLINQGYEDCNDVKHLKHDPILNELSEGRIVSQPTLSRFENSLTRQDIYRSSEHFVENWIASLPAGKKEVIIDIDSTDSPTYGNQQMSMYNGFYKEYMYNPLLIHDGETGQLILPVLRAGNVHTANGFVPILRRIVERLRKKHPNIKIIIRGDSGFSGAEFYNYAEKQGLSFCVGMPSTPILEEIVKIEEELISHWFKGETEIHQYFTDKIEYQAKTWDKPQNVYAKIESTRLGMNKRFYCSNLLGQTAKELYKDFYVKRGDRSENRIKELKAMCFSGRLSCHEFYANYFRLFLSSLSYEMFRLIKNKIRTTGHVEASKWQVSNIRLFLLKVGATITKRIKTLTISFSRSYVCRELLTEMLR